MNRTLRFLKKALEDPSYPNLEFFPAMANITDRIAILKASGVDKRSKGKKRGSRPPNRPGPGPRSDASASCIMIQRGRPDTQEEYPSAIQNDYVARTASKSTMTTKSSALSEEESVKQRQKVKENQKQKEELDRLANQTAQQRLHEMQME